MPDAARSLLLVDDDARIQQVNQAMLARHGFDIRLAMSLAEAKAELDRQIPDAMVLDIMLPDGSGLDFVRRLRAQGIQVPVLLLTALNESPDVVRGLASGGDDYLGKPYDYGVLVARLEAIMRRNVSLPQLIRHGELTLDVVANTAHFHGQDLLLTAKEFGLLLLLVRNQGHGLRAEQMFSSVWKTPIAGDKNALHTAMSRLRKKLGPTGLTIWFGNDEGYLLEQT